MRLTSPACMWRLWVCQRKQEGRREHVRAKGFTALATISMCFSLCLPCHCCSRPDSRRRNAPTSVEKHTFCKERWKVEVKMCIIHSVAQSIWLIGLSTKQRQFWVQCVTALWKNNITNHQDSKPVTKPALNRYSYFIKSATDSLMSRVVSTAAN